MNNFINVRVQSYNHTKQLNILKHNLRKIKSLSEGAFNDVVGTSKHTSNFIIQKDGSLFELENKDFINLSYDFIVDEYKKDRKLHNEKMYERKKRNLLNEQATWLEGVFTFSEAIHSDLGNKYTKEELSRVANNCAQDLAKQIGAELKYMVFHLDETTPHFHLAFKNFDDNGMSIFHKIKNKEFLSQIQDLAFEHFKELGMDRGIKKEFTSKNYQTITNYYKQQNIEIRAITSNLKSEIKGLQQAKKDVLADSELTKAEKKIELDKLDLEIKNKRNTIKEYNDLEKEFDAKIKAKNDEISSKDEELKTKNQEIDVANDTLIGLNKQITTTQVEVNDFKNIDKNIDKMVEKMIDNLVENPIGLLGKDAILDIDTLKDKMKGQLRKAFKTDIISKEVEEKDKVINDLKSELKDKDSVIEKVSTEKYEERSKNKVLTQDKGQNRAQNQKLIETMDKQQKMLLRENRTNTRRTNQRNKYFQKLMRDNNLTKAMQTRKFLRDNKTRDINKNKIKKTIEENYDLSR